MSKNVDELIELIPNLSPPLTELVVTRKGNIVKYVGDDGETFLGDGLYYTDNVAVQIAIMPKGASIKNHHHSCKEIGVIYKGVMEVTHNGNVYVCKVGGVMVFNPGEDHSVLALEDTKGVFITVPSDRGYPNGCR